MFMNGYIHYQANPPNFFGSLVSARRSVGDHSAEGKASGGGATIVITTEDGRQQLIREDDVNLTPKQVRKGSTQPANMSNSLFF